MIRHVPPSDKKVAKPRLGLRDISSNGTGLAPPGPGSMWVGAWSLEVLDMVEKPS